MLAMRGVLLGIAFLETKPNFISSLYEAISMNHSQNIEIRFVVIRDAILRIASEKPEWFYTEGWLKEILSITPSNPKPKASIGPGKAHGRNQREDNLFPDF